jgi:hypothetical protein
MSEIIINSGYKAVMSITGISLTKKLINMYVQESELKKIRDGILNTVKFDKKREDINITQIISGNYTILDLD